MKGSFNGSSQNKPYIHGIDCTLIEAYLIIIIWWLYSFLPTPFRIDAKWNITKLIEILWPNGSLIDIIKK